MFNVRGFVSEHTRILGLRQKDNRKATLWVITACIKRKYASHNHNYLPKSIIEDILNDYGIDMTYHKAWRCRKKD